MNLMNKIHTIFFFNEMSLENGVIVFLTRIGFESLKFYKLFVNRCTDFTSHAYIQALIQQV